MAYTKEQREEKERQKALEQSQNNSENKSKVADILEKKKKENSIRNLPISTEVWVHNNCYNELNYISKNTGFRTTWNERDSRSPMTLEELLIMRNTQRKFYEKPWIRISGFVDSDYDEVFSVEEILEFLQVKQYYKNSLCPENVDEIFKLSVDEIEKRVPNMSSGVKSSIVVRANDLVESGELDSLRTILTLEKILNCEISRPKI